jgi:hypothetical protein
MIERQNKSTYFLQKCAKFVFNSFFTAYAPPFLVVPNYLEKLKCSTVVLFKITKGTLMR